MSFLDVFERLVNWIPHLSMLLLHFLVEFGVEQLDGGDVIRLLHCEFAWVLDGVLTAFHCLVHGGAHFRFAMRKVGMDWLLWNCCVSCLVLSLGLFWSILSSTCCTGDVASSVWVFSEFGLLEWLLSVSFLLLEWVIFQENLFGRLPSSLQSSQVRIDCKNHIFVSENWQVWFLNVKVSFWHQLDYVFETLEFFWSIRIHFVLKNIRFPRIRNGFHLFSFFNWCSVLPSFGWGCFCLWSSLSIFWSFLLIKDSWRLSNPQEGILRHLHAHILHQPELIWPLLAIIHPSSLPRAHLNHLLEPQNIIKPAVTLNINSHCNAKFRAGVDFGNWNLSVLTVLALWKPQKWLSGCRRLLLVQVFEISNVHSAINASWNQCFILKEWHSSNGCGVFF